MNLHKEFTNVVTSIYQFNKQAGLLDKGYDADKESCFPIEEMLELYDVTTLCETLNVKEDYTPKNVSRKIIQIAKEGCSTILPKQYIEVDDLDRYLDTIVFAFGSIFKLGLTPQLAIEALEIVMEANMQKINAGQDTQGKQMKPKNFISPKAKLQKLLNRRGL